MVTLEEMGTMDRQMETITVTITLGPETEMETETSISVRLMETTMVT